MLRDRLLDPLSAADPVKQQGTLAAVLVALYQDGGELHVVLTKRRADLKRHAGEISFPGGRWDPADEDLCVTALREAEEEIGLKQDRVRLLGALQRTSTFVTGYIIQPFVGLIPEGESWLPAAGEVESVLEPSLTQLRTSKTRIELQRRGFTFETDAYVFDGQVVWGATARILEHLLGRLGSMPEHLP